MSVYGVIDRESVDEVFKNGLVKPNEYEFIRDNILGRELFLRKELIESQLDLFLLGLQGHQLIERFYLSETGIFDLKSSIIHLAYNDPDKLLIDQDDIATLILSDVAHSKALKVRDLGDINKSRLLVGEVLADKETFRSLEYLTKYKRGLWDLLDYLTEEK